MTLHPKRKFILRIACLIVAIISVISCTSAFFGCASKPGRAESDAYAKFVSGGKKLSVKAPINDDERKVFLFAIDMWQSPYDIAELEPLAKAKVKNSEASATVKLKNVDLSELVCKGFVFGIKNESGDGYSPVSSVYYITNPKEIHKNGKKIDESKLSGDLKGLIGTPTELLENGAKSTLVTVDLGRLLRGEGGVGVYSFVFNGISCHVDKNELDSLDAKIKAYTKAGVSVYLEIVQSKSYSEFGSRLSAIAFEGVSGASGYALNMRSRDGAGIISAALFLLSSRYSGGEHGRVDSFVIGRAVNNYSKYYADGLSLEEGVENYVRAVRLAYNLLLLNNPNGRVYASLGNNWTVSEAGGVSAKEFLTAFTNISESGGDFFWQLCLEANASDPSDSSIWDDPLSVGGGQFVSPANISTVVKLLSTSAYKCNGYSRNILLNRFAVGGSNQEAQAASYAYAYYNALATKRVNALIYASVNDGASGGVNSGLYSAAGGGMPTPKKLAEIFNAVEGRSVGDVSYIPTLVGSEWNKIYTNGLKLVKEKEIFKGAPVANISGKEISLITDFSGGDVFGFAPISSRYIELRHSDEKKAPALYASLDGGARFGESGVVTDVIPLKAFKKAGYLSISSMVEATGQNVRLTVRLAGFDKSGKEHVYVAEGEVKVGEWQELHFDVKDFLKKLDGDTITLAVTAESSAADTETTGLWISKINTSAPNKAEFPFWIIWVVIGLAVVGGLTAFVIWFRKNYTFVRE